MQNKLIVFEGIDGVGKTTLAKETKKIFDVLGIPSILYESTEEKNLGFNSIKPFVKTCSTSSSLLFYLASSVEKSFLINKLLKTHNVICDRYVFSTIAKHKALGFEIKNILDSVPIIMPDVLFLVTVEEKVRARRIKTKDFITLEDKVKKKKGSIPYKMEKYLKEFPCIILDNSRKIQDTIEIIKKSI